MGEDVFPDVDAPGQAGTAGRFGLDAGAGQVGAVHIELVVVAVGVLDVDENREVVGHDLLFVRWRAAGQETVSDDGG